MQYINSGENKKRGRGGHAKNRLLRVDGVLHTQFGQPDGPSMRPYTKKPLVNSTIRALKKRKRKQSNLDRRNNRNN